MDGEGAGDGEAEDEDAAMVAVVVAVTVVAAAVAVAISTIAALGVVVAAAAGGFDGPEAAAAGAAAGGAGEEAGGGGEDEEGDVARAIAAALDSALVRLSSFHNSQVPSKAQKVRVNGRWMNASKKFDPTELSSHRSDSVNICFSPARQ